MGKVKKVTVINEKGEVCALRADFKKFLKHGESEINTHALIGWYPDFDSFMVGDSDAYELHIIPLDRVFFDDISQYEEE